MDVDKDQAIASDDLKLFKDGAYLYKSDNEDYDVNKFDRFYEQYRDKRNEAKAKKLRERLEELNKPEKKVPIYSHSIGRIVLDAKDVLFNLLDDILQGRMEARTFIKHNRLFYIGITLLAIAGFMYLYTIVIGTLNTDKKNDNKLEIIHIHKIVDEAKKKK